MASFSSRGTFAEDNNLFTVLMIAEVTLFQNNSRKWIELALCRI